MVKRRDFLLGTGAVTGLLSSPELLAAADSAQSGAKESGVPSHPTRPFNGAYTGEHLNLIAFPMGGMGAGMVCLEGSGGLSKFSLRHRPDLETQHRVFSAIAIRGAEPVARLLEGPVPVWKLRPSFPNDPFPNSVLGLPRFEAASFEARFPFGRVTLKDPQIPLDVVLTGWSPFQPGDADNASLPVAGLEYHFVNGSNAPVSAVFSFSAENFLAPPPPIGLFGVHDTFDRIRSTAGGFVLYSPGMQDKPSDEGSFAAWTDDPDAQINHAWFRGTWIGSGSVEAVQMIWNDIAAGKCYARGAVTSGPAPGATLFVPFTLAAGQSKTIGVRLAWYFPKSNVFAPQFEINDGKLSFIERATSNYTPWYAGRFASAEEVKLYWQKNYESLRRASEAFSDAFFDSTLPPEVTEAVAANLSILKSPTVLRQTDGRLWAWEGSNDEAGGGGYGSCTHVWNYAQALPHLFPDLERTFRETEFGPDLGADGFQAHRAALPIRSIGDTSAGRGIPAAADGQAGSIIGVFREWRIGGDTDWLRKLWPKVRLSLDYCIATWDPQRKGWFEEAHLTTYDVKFWGADCMCTSLYLGALKAAVLMGRALGDPVNGYGELLSRGARRAEEELFNGEYFLQKTQWQGLHTSYPPAGDAVGVLLPVFPEAQELSTREGPAYQFGMGCLSAGVLGEWMCLVCGVGEMLNREKVVSHLRAVHRYNFKSSVARVANAFRPALACGEESGLLNCSWPNGGRPSLPVNYADEVWSGVEYQVASHLIAVGLQTEGLQLVRATRTRYDGRVRNPFSEIEAGNWYARAMSSYALLQALSGARYDAVDKILYLKPLIKGDFRSFLSTATGYGTVGVKNGKAFVTVVSGNIPYSKIEYAAHR